MALINIDTSTVCYDYNDVPPKDRVYWSNIYIKKENSDTNETPTLMWNFRTTSLFGALYTQRRLMSGIIADCQAEIDKIDSQIEKLSNEE